MLLILTESKHRPIRFTNFTVAPLLSLLNTAIVNAIYVILYVRYDESEDIMKIHQVLQNFKLF